MYVGTYGTLMREQSRHGVLGSSKFMGMYRSRWYDSLLLRTPAGYPAFVRCHENYMADIVNQTEEWWDDYMDDNPDTIDPVIRTQWGSGLDTPLIEVYSASPTVIDRLDIIEGVPHLYQKSNTELHPLQPDNVTKAKSMTAWKRTIAKQTKEFPENMRLSEEELYEATPLRKCMVYIMSPKTDWLQGCDIIWNGDFKNPLINDNIKFEYTKWVDKLKKKARPHMGEDNPTIQWTNP